MPRKRWTPEQARDWYARQPWLAGCNFIPSTAANQLEMWQAESFDLETIDRELGFAESVGFNAARVFLHDLLWKHDPAGFADRIERFLRVCDGRSIRVLFVLFDGVWDPQPRLGAQPAPRPRVHNSRWVQSPGAALLADADRHDELRGYVTGVIDAFAEDRRIIGWDLFNEPDNPNLAYAGAEIANKAEMATLLLRKAFAWARDASPSQPLTAGVWRGRVKGDAVPEINRLMLEESDVLSFHSYLEADRVRSRIRELQEFERPVMLTEFMSRDSGSTFEAVLPVTKEHKVAAFCWGLVAGKTQTVYPWDSWVREYTQEPEPWFHDVFRPDGTPYDERETDFLREITATQPEV